MVKSSHSSSVSSFSSHVKLSQSSSMSKVSRLATNELSEQCLQRGEEKGIGRKRRKEEAGSEDKQQKPPEERKDVKAFMQEDK